MSSDSLSALWDVFLETKLVLEVTVRVLTPVPQVAPPHIALGILFVSDHRLVPEIYTTVLSVPSTCSLSPFSSRKCSLNAIGASSKFCVLPLLLISLVGSLWCPLLIEDSVLLDPVSEIGVVITFTHHDVLVARISIVENSPWDELLKARVVGLVETALS